MTGPANDEPGLNDPALNDPGLNDPGFDLGGLLAQAQAMQSQLSQAQAQAAEAEVVGQAGGGAVKIRATGGLEFREVSIEPAAVDPAEVELLEDMVLAAINDAVAQANRVNEQALSGLSGLGGLLGDPGRPS